MIININKLFNVRCIFILTIVALVLLIIFRLLNNKSNYEGYENNTENNTENHTENDDARIQKLSKKDCELVIARYNEDISWSKPYAHLRTVSFKRL
jgi:hypothetical protein